MDTLETAAGEASSREEVSGGGVILIMGCPRSGTTLVSQILDAHSRLAIYQETNYYTLFRPDRHLYGLASD